ncbi:hypothetical protein N7528_007340 [Penicillium herquei]|nr:hypothetical protein N7528_007340 [Penicillium herquei]
MLVIAEQDIDHEQSDHLTILLQTWAIDPERLLEGKLSDVEIEPIIKRVTEEVVQTYNGAILTMIATFSTILKSVIDIVALIWSKLKGNGESMEDLASKLQNALETVEAHLKRIQELEKKCEKLDGLVKEDEALHGDSLELKKLVMPLVTSTATASGLSPVTSTSSSASKRQSHVPGRRA